MTRLEQLRLDSGRTPEQLADIVKASARTIRRIEAGRSKHVVTLAKLSAYFGVPASDLIRDALPVRDVAA